jgi:hydroxymethylbilane synthase
MSKVIRIGSRESALAIWQAEKVQGLLKEIGLESEIVRIKSKGDIVLNKPLYELGVVGVFTKALDVALLNGEIDIAVHSMKDVPTLLPAGVSEYAVLERGDVMDVVVKKDEASNIIATGSLRRKAQWLHRHPEHEVVGLRGNVVKRLEKVEDSNWYGAIFAKAGLERIGILPQEHEVLDWMVPAPAQGALMIVGLEENAELASKVGELTHEDTQLAVSIERAFLRELEGGCTAPIGALAEVKGGDVKFVGVLSSLDGETELRVEGSAREGNTEMGAVWAKDLLSEGGEELMEEIKKHMSNGKA